MPWSVRRLLMPQGRGEMNTWCLRSARILGTGRGGELVCLCGDGDVASCRDTEALNWHSMCTLPTVPGPGVGLQAADLLIQAQAQELVFLSSSPSSFPF